MSAPVIRLYTATSKSPRHPDPNEIMVAGMNVSRNGATVRLPALERRLFLILAVRQNHIVSKAEIVEMLYGDDVNGGPEWALKVVEVMIVGLRDAGAALGFRIDNRHARGVVMTLVPYSAADLKEIEHAA